MPVSSHAIASGIMAQINYQGPYLRRVSLRAANVVNIKRHFAMVFPLRAAESVENFYSSIYLCG
jgi:hypothetical protein